MRQVSSCPPVRRPGLRKITTISSLFKEFFRIGKESVKLYPQVCIPIIGRFLLVWFISFIPGYLLYTAHERLFWETPIVNLISGTLILAYLDVAITLTLYHSVFAVALENVIPSAKQEKWSQALPFVNNGILGAVMLLALVFGGVLLILPGLLLFMAFAFAPTLHIDRGIGLEEALRRSVEVFFRHFRIVAMTFLFTGGLLLLSLWPIFPPRPAPYTMGPILIFVWFTLKLLIPFLIVLPFTTQALAILYRDYYFKARLY